MNNDLTLVSQSLHELGYRDLATTARTPIGAILMSDLVKLCAREARSRQDGEMLDRLQMSGLIY